VYDSASNDFTTAPPSYGPIASNPVYAATGFDYDANVLSILSNIQLLYKITDNLHFSAWGGINIINSSNRFFKRHPPGFAVSSSEAGFENANILTLQNTNMLAYKKRISNIHNLGVTVIMEQQSGTNTGNSSWASAFPTILLGYNNLSLGGSTRAGSTYAQSSLLSYLGRINYDLMDRYLFTFSMRADGSSKFQPKNKWGYFPSAAFAWRLSKASFIARSNIFEDLKLRMSYGVTGSQAINPYQTQNLLVQSQNYTFNGSGISVGIGPGVRSNPDLRWESTTQYNMGLDFTLFDGRLNGSVDVYHKKTNDLLMPKAIPLYNGGGFISTNIGSLQNRGIEGMVSWRVIDIGKLRINSAVNISANRSKMLDLGNVEQVSTNGGFETASPAPPFMLRVGEPLGQFWGFTFLGLWKSHEAAEAAKFGKVPGDSRYADLNDDKEINGNDMHTIGNAQPDYTWGWNTDIDFRNFELNIFFNGVSGNQVWNYTRSLPIVTGADVRSPTSRAILNRWSRSNENTSVPGFSRTDVTHAQSSHFVEDGSYIRLSNITFAYNLAPAAGKGLPITDTRFFVSMQNPFVITKYKGFDPELSSTPIWSDVAQGIDNASYPAIRTITAGVKLTF
jgi:TonB-linked SusC/RagA family outer membrane protein